MIVATPASTMGLARAARALPRLLVSNGVFALMAVLMLLGTLTLQLARDHSDSRHGASAFRE